MITSSLLTGASSVSTDPAVGHLTNYPEPMWSQRQFVEYGLKRRHVVESLRGPDGRRTRARACDADPLLVRSAVHHGVESTDPCPACRADRLRVLRYVFGSQLGQYSGRIKSVEELEEMENEVGEFKVCVVEVCVECGWNFMIQTYVLGDGQVRKPPRRQKTVEDIYG